MALTGLEIYKQLPKTNCRDCGLPTCLAFAMKMAIITPVTSAPASMPAIKTSPTTTTICLFIERIPKP